MISISDAARIIRISKELRDRLTAPQVEDLNECR
jgi:hypothetical protein